MLSRAALVPTVELERWNRDCGAYDEYLLPGPFQESMLRIKLISHSVEHSEAAGVFVFMLPKAKVSQSKQRSPTFNLILYKFI